MKLATQYFIDGDMNQHLIKDLMSPLSDWPLLNKSLSYMTYSLILRTQAMDRLDKGKSEIICRCDAKANKF